MEGLVPLQNSLIAPLCTQRAPCLHQLQRLAQAVRKKKKKKKEGRKRKSLQKEEQRKGRTRDGKLALTEGSPTTTPWLDGKVTAWACCCWVCSVTCLVGKLFPMLDEPQTPLINYLDAQFWRELNWSQQQAPSNVSSWLWDTATVGAWAVGAPGGEWWPQGLCWAVIWK